MPSSREVQEKRRQAIVEILRDRSISQQRDLVRMLLDRGITATQSSVSRDLKEIGAVRAGERWRLPDWAEGSLFSKVVHYVLDVRTAGPHLTLIETAPGAGAVVAQAVNGSHWEEIVGMVEGAGSVLLLTEDALKQRLLLARLHNSRSAFEEYPGEEDFEDAEAGDAE